MRTSSTFPGASAGDLLLVRSGSYHGFRLSKALTIVGSGPAATVVAFGGSQYQNLTVENLPAGSLVSIANLSASVIVPSTSESLTVRNCAGTVAFDNVRSTYRASVRNSADVRASASVFESPLQAIDSTLAFERCDFTGGPISFFENRAGLTLSGGEAVLSRCSATGGEAYVVGGHTVEASPGLALSETALTLTGDGSGGVIAGSGSPTPAVAGEGTLDLDPHVVLQPAGGAAAVDVGITVVPRPIPSLAVDGGPPGGTADYDLFGTAGDDYYLFVGTAKQPYRVRPVLGDAWIQPIQLWRAGTFDATGHVLGAVTLPNDPTIIGLAVTWQALSRNATTGLVASNPVTNVHGM